MTSEVADNDRLDLLEAELARLRAERDRETAGRELLATPQGPKMGLAASARERAQMAAVEARRAAHAEQERLYAERLAANEPRIAKIKRELAAIGEEQRAEQERHAQTMAALAEKVPQLTRRLAELQRPPDAPEPDYTIAARLAAECATDEQVAVMGADGGAPRRDRPVNTHLARGRGRVR